MTFSLRRRFSGRPICGTHTRITRVVLSAASLFHDPLSEENSGGPTSNSSSRLIGTNPVNFRIADHPTNGLVNATP